MSRYQEIASQLRQEITDGAYRRGDLLPGEVPLAAAYEVSRATMRRALAELERDGIVRVSHGRGRFVGPPLPEFILPARPNRTETVAGFLKAAILAGEWRPGARLPGEASLAAIYGVARVTVRSALALLAKEGLIVTKHGVGSIVQSHPAEQLAGKPEAL